MSLLEELSGPTLREVAEVLAARKAVPPSPKSPSAAEPDESPLAAIGEATGLSPESAARALEALEAAGDALPQVEKALVFPADELTSGGVLVREHRVLIELASGKKPRKRKKKAAAPLIGPRIVRCAEKALSAGGEPESAPAAEPEPPPPPAPAAPWRRPKPVPRGRFTSGGVLQGLGKPEQYDAPLPERTWRPPRPDPRAPQRPESPPRSGFRGGGPGATSRPFSRRPGDRLGKGGPSERGGSKGSGFKRPPPRRFPPRRGPR